MKNSRIVMLFLLAFIPCALNGVLLTPEMKEELRRKKEARTRAVPAEESYVEPTAPEYEEAELEEEVFEEEVFEEELAPKVKPAIPSKVGRPKKAAVQASLEVDDLFKEATEKLKKLKDPLPVAELSRMLSGLPLHITKLTAKEIVKFMSKLHSYLLKFDKIYDATYTKPVKTFVLTAYNNELVGVTEDRIEEMKTAKTISRSARRKVEENLFTFKKLLLQFDVVDDEEYEDEGLYGYIIGGQLIVIHDKEDLMTSTKPTKPLMKIIKATTASLKKYPKLNRSKAIKLIGTAAAAIENKGISHISGTFKTSTWTKTGDVALAANNAAYYVLRDKKGIFTTKNYKKKVKKIGSIIAVIRQDETLYNAVKQLLTIIATNSKNPVEGDPGVTFSNGATKKRKKSKRFKAVMTLINKY